MGQVFIFCNQKSILSKQKCQEEVEDHRQVEDPVVECSAEVEAQPDQLHQLPQDQHQEDQHQHRKPQLLEEV